MGRRYAAIVEVRLFLQYYFSFMYSSLRNISFPPQHFGFPEKQQKRKIFYSIFHLLNTLQEWVR